MIKYNESAADQCGVAAVVGGAGQAEPLLYPSKALFNITIHKRAAFFSRFPHVFDVLKLFSGIPRLQHHKTVNRFS
jgi:hypothetical protein